MNNQNKQIEEMAKALCGLDRECEHCTASMSYICKAKKYAERAYNTGYRKQSEGEWVEDEQSKFKHRYHCSVCNFYLIGAPTKCCEECGARMKGGANNV